jgi:hypothetical protein
MFLGPKLNTVFASRWKALAWSGGVLLTAYCSVPSNDEDGTKSTAVDPTVAAVAGLMGVGTPAQADSHVSPWGIASPAPVPHR